MEGFYSKTLWEKLLSEIPSSACWEKKPIKRSLLLCKQRFWWPITLLLNHSVLYIRANNHLERAYVKHFQWIFYMVSIMNFKMRKKTVYLRITLTWKWSWTIQSTLAKWSLKWKQRQRILIWDDTRYKLWGWSFTDEWISNFIVNPEVWDDVVDVFSSLALQLNIINLISSKCVTLLFISFVIPLCPLCFFAFKDFL